MSYLLNESLLERKCRARTACVGCGEDKQTGLVVCWKCFKGIDNPLKYHDGDFKDWLISKGVDHGSL